MRSRYREHPAASWLSAHVECFWTIEPGPELSEYPVLPDGCVDILFLTGDGRGVQVVGAMTTARKLALPAKETAFGVRFRPAMSNAYIRIPGAQLRDQSIRLNDVWGISGRELSDKITEATSTRQRIGLIEEALRQPAESGVVQRVCPWILSQGGQAGIETVAFQAGISPRQLRRVFLDQIGLTPKHFCRVMRFRRGMQFLTSSPRGGWAQVALECGYYDQAHFDNEFRALSGYSPSQFMALER